MILHAEYEESNNNITKNTEHINDNDKVNLDTEEAMNKMDVNTQNIESTKDTIEPEQ